MRRIVVLVAVAAVVLAMSVAPAFAAPERVKGRPIGPCYNTVGVTASGNLHVTCAPRNGDA